MSSPHSHTSRPKLRSSGAPTHTANQVFFACTSVSAALLGYLCGCAHVYSQSRVIRTQGFSGGLEFLAEFLCSQRLAWSSYATRAAGTRGISEEPSPSSYFVPVFLESILVLHNSRTCSSPFNIYRRNTYPNSL